MKLEEKNNNSKQTLSNNINNCTIIWSDTELRDYDHCPIIVNYDIVFFITV